MMPRQRASGSVMIGVHSRLQHALHHVMAHSMHIMLPAMKLSSFDASGVVHLCYAVDASSARCTEVSASPSTAARTIDRTACARRLRAQHAKQLVPETRSCAVNPGKCDQP